MKKSVHFAAFIQPNWPPDYLDNEKSMPFGRLQRLDAGDPCHLVEKAPSLMESEISTLMKKVEFLPHFVRPLFRISSIAVRKRSPQFDRRP